MTIEEVRKNLPDVKVLWDGKIYDGIVRGARRKFPRVYINGLPSAIEYSWDAIARSISSGNPLII